MLVVAIDVGILNLGFVVAHVSEEGIVVKVDTCRRIDITHFRHAAVRPEHCLLHHDALSCDYMSHFVQEHGVLFKADVILIERQPITGLNDVMNLLVFMLPRERVRILSPNGIHARYAMSHDYDVRRVESVVMMNRMYGEVLPADDIANYADRLHDISDCFLMIRSFADDVATAARRRRATCAIERDIERFRFRPSSATQDH